MIICYRILIFRLIALKMIVNRGRTMQTNGKLDGKMIASWFKKQIGTQKYQKCFFILRKFK